MAEAKQAFHWPDPVAPTFFDVGDPVPDDIARQVGEHLIDGHPGDGADIDQGEPDLAAMLEGLLAAGEIVRGEDVEGKVEAAVLAYRDREQAAYDALADRDEPFDPSGESADAVKAYLTELDIETVNGLAEFERVADLEREGKNRSTAIPTA